MPSFESLLSSTTNAFNSFDSLFPDWNTSVSSTDDSADSTMAWTEDAGGQSSSFDSQSNPFADPLSFYQALSSTQSPHSNAPASTEHAVGQPYFPDTGHLDLLADTSLPLEEPNFQCLAGYSEQPGQLTGPTQSTSGPFTETMITPSQDLTDWMSDIDMSFIAADWDASSSTSTNNNPRNANVNGDRLPGAMEFHEQIMADYQALINPQEPKQRIKRKNIRRDENYGKSSLQRSLRNQLHGFRDEVCRLLCGEEAPMVYNANSRSLQELHKLDNDLWAFRQAAIALIPAPIEEHSSMEPGSSSGLGGEG